MHDIVNTNKHFELIRPKSDFKELKIYEGNSLNFSKPPCVQIIMNDGKEINGTKAIEKVYNFWIRFLNDLYIDSL